MTIRLHRAPFTLSLGLALLVALLLGGLFTWSPVSASQCAYAVGLNPRIFALPETGGTRTLEIQFSQACQWTAKFEPDTEGWITFVGASSGTGNGRVQINVAPNAAASLRYGTLTINTQKVTIGQQGAFNKCQAQPLTPGVSVSNTLANDACLRGNYNTFNFSHLYTFNGRAGEIVNVITQSLTANTSLGYTLTGPDGQAPASVLPSPPSNLRRLHADGLHTLEVLTDTAKAPVSYQVTLQQMSPGCENFAVSALDKFFSAAAGNGRVMISAARNCSWQAVSNSSWLTLPTIAGQGSQFLNFNLAENTTTKARSAIIDVAGQQAVIRQAGRGGQCAPVLLTPGETVAGTLVESSCNPGSPFGYAEGWVSHYEFQGRAGQRVALESATTTGVNSFVRLNVLNPRGVGIAIGDRRVPQPQQELLTLPEDGIYSVLVSSYQQTLGFTLRLDLTPADCSYAVAPARTFIAGSGETVNVTLQTQAQCPWKLVKKQESDWMRPVPAIEAEGMGTRTIPITVPANTTGSRRESGFVWGGQPFQIIQGGAPNSCTVTPLTPGTPHIGALDFQDCPAQFLPQPSESIYSQFPGELFSFSGTAGQVFSFTAIQHYPPQPSFIVPLTLVGYALLDPQGKLIMAGVTNPNLPQPSLALPVSGTYQFEFSMPQPPGYPGYALTVWLTPSPPVIGCSIKLNAASTRFEAAGGNGTIQIEAPANCPWRLTLENNSGQIRFNDPLMGVGGGQVRFSFPANTFPRSSWASVRLGNQLISLVQAGRGGTCSTQVLPFDQFVTGYLSSASCPLTPISSGQQNSVVNRYNFAGQAGEQIALTTPRMIQPAIAPDAPALFAVPTLRLYDPDGNLMNDTLTTRTLNGRYLLPKTGNYTVEAIAASYITISEYQLLLERLTTGCLYSTMSPLQRFDSNAATGSFRLMTGGACQWTPRSNAPWVVVTNPAGNATPLGSSSGAAEVTFTVQDNGQPAPRNATIVAGGQAIEIEQSGIGQAGTGGTCAIRTLTPNQPVSSALTASDCWARGGQGLADFYQLTARSGERLRFITTNVANSGLTFTLLDNAWQTVSTWTTAMSPDLTPTSGTYFLQVSNQTASGPYTLNLETTTANCQYAVTLSASDFYGNGGTGTVRIATGAGCAWTATNGANGVPHWLNVTGNATGTGSGSFTFRVDPFELIGGVRGGLLEVANQRLTIWQTQSASPDTCNVVPLEFNQPRNATINLLDCVSRFMPVQHTSRADRYSFTARAGQQFAFEVIGGPGQLTLYDATGRVITRASGERLPFTGTGNPMFMVLPDNQTYFIEVAVAHDAPVNYTVRLYTPTQCVYDLVQLSPSPNNHTLPAAGGTGTLQVITGAGCDWALRLYDPVPSWLTLAKTSGSGTTTIPFTVAPNDTPKLREALIALGTNSPSIRIEQQGVGAVCAPRAVAAGQTVRGKITEADCRINPRPLGNTQWPSSPLPAHSFTFTAQAGDQLAAALRAGENLSPGGVFALFDPAGAPVPLAFDTNRIPISNQRNETRATLPLTGSYTLYLFSTYGDYEFVLDLTTGGCGFALESDDAQVPTAGGSGTVSVITGSNCRWTAYSTDPWLTVTQGNGTGNGPGSDTIRFTATANPGTVSRVGVIQLSGNFLPIVQAGATGQCAPIPITAGQPLAGSLTQEDCRRLGVGNQFTFQPVDRYRFTAKAGESLQVKVVNNAALGVQILPLSSLRATSVPFPSQYLPPQPVDWFGTASLIAPADGDYLIEVMPALGAGLPVPYTIHLQSNAPGCGVVLNDTPRTFPSVASAGSFNVTAPTGCRWQTYAVHDWITVNGDRERTGAQSVSYSLAANPDAQWRWGAIIVGGQIYLIEQAGAGDGQDAPGTCQTGQLTTGQTVYGELSPADCRPLSTSSNALTADRYRFTGTAGQRIQIVARQANGKWPALTLFDARLQPLTESFNAGQEQPPHTRIPAAGEFFTLPADGEYFVEIGLRRVTHNEPPPRSAYSLSLVSLSLGCGYSTNAQSLRFNAAGGNGSINLTTSSTCQWTAAATDAWVVSQSNAVQTGSGSLSFKIEPNATAQSRRSLLLVGGSICVIEQAGLAGSCLTTPLLPGQTVIGTLDVNDCLTNGLPRQDAPASGAQAYSERYSFDAQTNDRVQLTVTTASGAPLPAGGFRARLIAPNGVTLFSNVNGSLPATATNDAFALPQTGNYEIEISANNKFDFAITLRLNRSNCQFTVVQREMNFEAAGGNQQLTLTANETACPWQAVSNAPWLTFANQSNKVNGTGNASLPFTVAANPNATARFTNIIIGDRSITIWQAGSDGLCAPRALTRNQLVQGNFDESGCGYLRRLNATGQLFYSDRYLLTATANERLSVSLQTNVIYPRLELLDPQGRLVALVNDKRLPAGAGEIILPIAGTYTLIVSSASKASYLMLATDSSACAFTVTPDPIIFSGAGGQRPIQITAIQPHCAWTARLAAGWLNWPLDSLGGVTRFFSGSRSIEFSVGANPGAARLGYLYIGDRVITLQQDARQLIPVAEPLVCANAATYATGSQAPDALVAAFGKRLATETQVATNWTTSLADTTVTVTDAAGVKRNGYVLFVSPTQVNYVMPANTASGLALVEIISGDGYVTSCTLTVTSVAPGLFSANATGQGWANGLALRVKADQSQVYEPLVQYDTRAQDFIPQPLAVNQPDEKVFLVLFGTGWRWRNDLANVTARIGGIPLPIQYCGSGPTNYLGLDQLNIELPASFAGRGKVTLELTVEGQNANPLQFVIK